MSGARLLMESREQLWQLMVMKGSLGSLKWVMTISRQSWSTLWKMERTRALRELPSSLAVSFKQHSNFPLPA